jgi:hypothetical protein
MTGTTSNGTGGYWTPFERCYEAVRPPYTAAVPSTVAQYPCRCLLCEPGDDLTDRQADVARHVQEFGWHAAGVLADDLVPGWGYSIGLWHTYRSPEVCILGLSAEPCMAIVNVVGEQVRDGATLRAGDRLTDVINGYDVVLRNVHGEWFPDLFGQAIGFYRRPPVPMLQICWPDRAGRFGWDDGVDESCRQRQAQLWLPFDEHPRGAWTGLRDEPDWPFGEACPDQGVFISKRITAGEVDIVGVVHDSDGDWQFLDGGPVTADDGALVHLRHIVTAHPHVAEVADLRPGEQAWRQADGTWQRSAAEETTSGS